jgi:hypothetical protein
MGFSHLATSVVSQKGKNNLGIPKVLRESSGQKAKTSRGEASPCKRKGYLRELANPKGVETPQGGGLTKASVEENPEGEKAKGVAIASGG